MKMKDYLLTFLKHYAYKKGDFTLSSGKKSEHYINCKPVILTGVGLDLTCRLMLEHVNTPVVAGMTLGADPLVSCVAIIGNKDGLIIRKEPKGYGAKTQIEGPLPKPGTKITVLEDVVTTGGSSIKAVKVLLDAGYLVDEVIAIVDRQEGGTSAMLREGLTLKSLYTIKDFE